MKNKIANWRWICIGLTIVSGLGLIYQHFRGFLLTKFLLPKEAATIGIIGGADGPTAIFVTSKFSPSLIQCLLLLGLVTGIAGFIILRKQKK